MTHDKFCRHEITNHFYFNSLGARVRYEVSCTCSAIQAIREDERDQVAQEFFSELEHAILIVKGDSK